MEPVMRPVSRSARRGAALARAVAMTFLPTLLATGVYALVGCLWQGLPALALFSFTALLVLMPLELLLLWGEHKTMPSERGCFLRDTMSGQQRVSPLRFIGTVALCFGVAGLLSAVLLPWENAATASFSAALRTPAYFCWGDMELYGGYSKPVLVFTAVVYTLLNVVVGPFTEELYFRGMLTRKLASFGVWAPVLVTLLFSFYHFWLPTQNLFRIAAFLLPALAAYKRKNLWIGIAFHVACNLVSTVGFLLGLFGAAGL